MPRFITVFLLLYISSCAALASDSATPSRSGGGLFALRSCAPELPCVYGQLQQGATLYLLGIDSSRTCPARASKTFMADFEAGDDFPLTKLHLGECTDISWRLAFTGTKHPTYKILKTHFVPEAHTAREIERLIRLRAQDLEKVGGEHPIKLSSKAPKVLSLPSQAKNTYLVSFDNDSGAKDPTHFLFAQGRIELIHGAAKLISSFTLNGNTYVHFEFGCKIGCGWRGDFVVQFSGTQFRTVMFEDAGSA